MAIDIRGAGSSPPPQHAPAPTTPQQVARQLLYAADGNSDGVVNAKDVVFHRRLAGALQITTGQKALRLPQLTRLAASHAGPDRRLDDSEFAGLSEALRLAGSVVRLPEQTPEGYWPSYPDAAREVIARTDVTYDGRVDIRDVNAGSDMASGVMTLLGPGPHTATTVDAALRIWGPPGATREERLRDFVGEWLRVSQAEAMTYGDIGRVMMQVADTDKDLRLTGHDGARARVALKAAGVKTMREHQIVALVGRYDTVGLYGPKPDGRIGAEELRKLYPLLAPPGDERPPALLRG